jgi:CIC family chloride channel protein
MRRRIAETLVDAIKRYGWALVLGAVSGLACVSVRLAFRGLQWILTQQSGLLPQAAATLSPARRLITPIAGAALATLIAWSVKRWTRPGSFQEYIEAVHFRQGTIVFLSTFWRTVCSAFSVASGAAIGREGSMIQFAAAVTSWLGRRSPIRSFSLVQQVSCGAAAAVAAAYQAPLAGVFFACEIVRGNYVWTELPALAIASAAGYLASRLILGAGPLFAVHAALPLTHSTLFVLPLALLLGCLAPAYQKLLHSLNATRRWPAALVWGGCVVGLLGLISPDVWGNGDVALITTLAGRPDLLGIVFLLLLRLIATTVSVGTGTVGGVFTPTLFAGAALGLAAGQILHVPQPVLFAVAGLSAFLAAVTHAPVMAALMASELTGQYHLLPVLLAANVGAWLVARSLSSHSLYLASVPANTPALES